MKFRDNLGTEDGTESVSIVDIVVVKVGAGVVAGDTGVIVVMLLGEPLHVLLFSIFSPNIESRQTAYNILAYCL